MGVWQPANINPPQICLSGQDSDKNNYHGTDPILYHSSASCMHLPRWQFAFQFIYLYYILRNEGTKKHKCASNRIVVNPEIYALLK